MGDVMCYKTKDGCKCRFVYSLALNESLSQKGG
jgi:hypothetical protein